MYTIVMDNNKNLNTTVRAVLYKNENLADKIQFLLPLTYDGNEGREVVDEETGDIIRVRDGVIDLSEYTVTLKYVDPNGNFHSEVLVQDAEKYKNRLRYTLPVNSKITAVAGNIAARLTLIYFEEEGAFNKIETNSTQIHIDKPQGFDDYVNFEDIEAFKKEVSELKKAMPDDLAVDEKDKLHLTHEGTPIGEGVEIAVPIQFDDLDGENDGVIDVDNIDRTPTPVYQFVDVD